jgi:hypothetical protein
MIQVKSRAEAIEWASRCPAGDNDVIEVRQVREISEFPADVQETVAKYPEVQKQFGHRKWRQALRLIRAAAAPRLRQECSVARITMVLRGLLNSPYECPVSGALAFRAPLTCPNDQPRISSS